MGAGTGLEKEFRKGRGGKRVLKFIVFTTLFILMLISGFVASYKFVTDDLGNKDNEVTIDISPEQGIPVEIPMGSSTDKIAAILQEKGLVKYPAVFKLQSKLNGYDGMYKSGTHIVSYDLDYDKLMRVLASKPVSVRVTIPEGYTFNQIMDELTNKKLIDKAKFSDIAKNEKYDFEYLKGANRGQNLLEGYLFPDTYEFDMKAGENAIIKIMLKNFDDKFKPEYYKRLKDLNMTVDKVITLASIIEKEAKLPEDRKVIAGVFYNRLNGRYGAPRRLESCATMQYIYLTREAGNTPEDTKKRIARGVILDNDKKTNDPFNTYKFDGLPPGPICSPGKAAIEAALYPEDTSYIYFVAKGDGGTYFSKTLAEHNAAVAKYGIK